MGASLGRNCPDRLAWCREIAVRCNGGCGAGRFAAGCWKFRLPVLMASSAWTSTPRHVSDRSWIAAQRRTIPFSSKILSRREFLYRSIRHSSAAVRWLCWRVVSCSSLCLMVASSCLMYSVRRSRKAAWACLFRCFRSSDVAYIWRQR